MKRTVFFTAAVALLCLVWAVTCTGPENGDNPGKPVEKIEVTTMPAKTEYNVGDDFDPAGMVVTATYTDGTTEAVTGYTCELDSSRTGDQEVLVIYEKKRAVCNVNIIPAGVNLVSIAVTTPPSKQEYKLNETLNTAGMVVTATYTNNHPAQAVKFYTTSALDSSSTGKKTITVTYNGKTANFSVDVIQWNGKLSVNAQRLLNYLKDMYGEKIISGQMDTAWTENSTMDMIKRVYDDTGKYPALKGFDFIDLPRSWSGYGRNQVEEAIEWWEGKNRMGGQNPATVLLPNKPDIHGIVSFCWHWRTGADLDFYSYRTDFRIPMNNGALDKSSAAFQTIKSDLDKVAALLQLLKDRDIPVLWRPLHEAGGDNSYPDSAGWFWWGASGTTNAERAAACVALWEYMYDYLTNDKGLDNLIWVWNGQKTTWFPDPATVHIISYDAYTNSNSQETARSYQSSTFTDRFNTTRNTRPNLNLIVALSENGAIPDPAWSKQNNILWSWFMTWNDRSGSTSGETHKDNFWAGEYHNTATHKTFVYNHELVITLDELPDLTAYRLD